MKKIIAAILGVPCLMAGIAGGYTYHLLKGNAFQIEKTAYIYIDQDDTADSVAVKVQKYGQPKTMTGYDIMCKLKKYGDHPRTGRYAINPNSCMYDFVRQLANGIQTPVKLTVHESRTVDALIGRMAKQLMIDSTAISNVLYSDNFIESLGYDKHTLPCMFIPNTYEVYWNITPEKLLQRLQKEKENFWNDTRRSKAVAAGLTIEQVATLASIVESESNYGPEKPTIAGLYLNRLHKGMKLQSDPTVIFALQDFTIRRVTLAMLTHESPYNTYVHEGLPPGPIRIPSTEGLDAVLNYEKSDYIYMCAKEDFSGSHNFTSSLTEHNNNARRYQQALNQRGIKR